MRYSSSRIQQETRLVTVEYLIEMVEIGRLDPDPTIGHRPKLPIMKKSQMVESLILGIPIDMIWSEQDALGKTQLLSGFEVLSNILDFKNNYFDLTGLRVLKHLNGLSYSKLDYAERKHFMQMEISLGAIFNDSDPMLKYRFVDNINRAKYGNSSAQLARNIIFKRAGNILGEHAQQIFNKFENTSSSFRRTLSQYYLKLQNEILHCLLIMYLDEFGMGRGYRYTMESYSYSRSHISNYTDYDNVEINSDDGLDNAITKIMFMLEIDDSRLKPCLGYTMKVIHHILEKESISQDSIGKNFSRLQFRQKDSSLLEYFCHSRDKHSKILILNSLMSVENLMDRLR
ncbi:hypothetical protein AAEH92_09050 [Shewanella xiamenensis]